MKHTDFAINMIREQLLGMVSCTRLRVGERNAVFEAAEIIAQLVKERDEARKTLSASQSPAAPPAGEPREILIAPDKNDEWRQVWKTEIYFNSEEERNEFDRKLTEGWAPLEWISAEDEAPAGDELVLCAVTGKHGGVTFHEAILLGSWNENDGWILESYPDIENPGVTHWMELPEGPGEG